MKLLFALLLTITLGVLVQAQAPRVVKVSASKILDDVAKRKKSQPGITAKELAAYANELLYDTELSDLALEVSSDGTVAFRDRAALGLKEGTWIENFPKDPNNEYLSFMKFEVGNKTYIIRFTAPCT